MKPQVHLVPSDSPWSVFGESRKDVCSEFKFPAAATLAKQYTYRAPSTPRGLLSLRALRVLAHLMFPAVVSVGCRGSPVHKGETEAQVTWQGSGGAGACDVAPPPAQDVRSPSLGLQGTQASVSCGSVLPALRDMFLTLQWWWLPWDTLGVLFPAHWLGCGYWGPAFQSCLMVTEYTGVWWFCQGRL